MPYFFVLILFCFVATKLYVVCMKKRVFNVAKNFANLAGCDRKTAVRLPAARDKFR